MRLRPNGLYESFRAAVLAEFHPQPGSKIMVALEAADALEAERETLQPAYTQAAQRVQALLTVINAPRPVDVVGMRPDKAAAWGRQLAELAEAQAAESAIAAELSRLSRAVKVKQAEIVGMLSFSTVDDAARRRELERVTQGAT